MSLNPSSLFAMAVAKSFDVIRQHLRLASGLVLFGFVFFHFVNHALGLISIDAMDAMRDWRVAVTRHPLISALLGLSLGVHILAGLWAFLSRGTWKMTMAELLQLASGLAIPLLLFRHIIGTRIAHEINGFDDNYTYALYAMWPGEAWSQTALIFLVWAHACIGLHYWMHLKEWYSRAVPFLFSLALLMPVLSFLGFAAAGRNVRFERDFKFPFTGEEISLIKTLMAGSVWAYAGLLVLLIGVRLALGAMALKGGKIKVSYGDERTVFAVPGQSLLEISRANAIPHASVCNGKARCSTCRVRVLEGEDQLSECDALEAKVLERVGVSGNIRLACQARPHGDVRIVPLMPASPVEESRLQGQDKFYSGVEQEVTVMFTDIRDFTPMAEKKLPYDVVFLLNQYLNQMGQAVEVEGGYVDKFMGDGMMAIFGMDQDPKHGARAALLAARQIAGSLQALNQSLHLELDGPVSIGIGIHTGPAILGRIGVHSGNGAGQRITALGDTVNSASRLESASKPLGAQLIVSQATLRTAGVALEKERFSQIELRGRSQRLDAAIYDNALELPAP